MSISSLTKTRPPPFAAIWGVLEYLENSGELSHCCEMISNGETLDDHVYCHVVEILRWLSLFPDPEQGRARDWLVNARGKISHAIFLRACGEDRCA